MGLLDQILAFPLAPVRGGWGRPSRAGCQQPEDVGHCRDAGTAQHCVRAGAPLVGIIGQGMPACLRSRPRMRSGFAGENLRSWSSAP